MTKLNLSVAVGPYDRTRALIDGTVQIDGVEPACMTLPPEEIFFRALRHAEFDICELSLSSFTVKTAQGGGDYVGVPCFVSRAFRHNAIWVRTDRIKKPEDLKGKKVGNNPWNANTLEWTTVSPPPHGNWAVLPTVYRGPYEYSNPARQDQDFWPQNEPAH